MIFEGERVVEVVREEEDIIGAFGGGEAHFWGDIDADDVSAACLEPAGAFAGTTAGIEDRFAVEVAISDGFQDMGEGVPGDFLPHGFVIFGESVEEDGRTFEFIFHKISEGEGESDAQTIVPMSKYGMDAVLLTSAAFRRSPLLYSRRKQ